jgi:HAE1 family hydrophobic/amphiphilic exporter-1
VKLPEFSVRHPVTTLMVFLALLVTGLVSLSRLGLELLPDISFPAAVVYTAYPGVGPEEVEASVTRPVEEAVSTLGGVERLSSTSSEGVSMVVINFSWATNMDLIVPEIREKVTAVQEQLPEGAERPVIVRYNPEYLPSIVITVSSATEGLDLRRLAEQQIQPELEKIEGVATVQLFGGRITAVTCSLDLVALSKLGIPISRILRVFEGENVNLPAGAMDLKERHVVLRALGEFRSLRDIENVLVGYREGVPVYLGEVARVRLGSLPREQFFRAGEAPGVQLLVRKQPGRNTVDVNRAVVATLARLEGRLPPSVKVQVQSDQSWQILNSIGGVAGAAWQGGLLAVLVLLLFLRNIPSTLIISVAIPLSVVATFSMMNFAGITLNIVSLMGLTLGVGMFVDNSIVVLESSYRKALAGLAPAQAAVEGAGEVATAISASTLTTLAVFFPIVFLKDLAGLIFRDLAYTVAFSLLISLVMALTLVPVLCARFLKTPASLRLAGSSGGQGKTGVNPREAPALDAVQPDRADLNVSLADIEVHTGNPLIDAASRGIQNALRALDELYARALGWALEHSTAVLLGAGLLLAVSLASVGLLGMEFLPETDEGQFAISMETRVGSSYPRTEEKVAQAERVVREVAGRDLVSISSSVGRGGSMRGVAETGSHFGVLEVRLSDKARRGRSQWQIIAQISRRLRTEVLDARFRFRLQGVVALAATVSGDTEPVVVEVSGDDLGRSSVLAERIAELMRGVPGLRDVEVSYKTGKPELQLRVRRREAASLGLSPLEIAATLRTAYKGTQVSTYREEAGSYEVYLILDEADRQSLAELRRLFFVNPAGEKIPLENVVEIVEGTGPVIIARENRTRMISVTAGLTGERALSRVMQDLRRGVQRLGAAPPGTSLRYSGSFQQMQESFRSLLLVLLLAVALVYMVMASQFESLLHPLIIMFSVPFSVIGMVAVLVLTHTAFSMMSFIGGILLVGIVVNNAIVLVDYMNRLQTRGLPLREAIILGGKTRLKPILMTSLTTIVGLLPMALGLGAGSEVRTPLGRAVVGGLLTSGLVTLILVPTLYWLVERRRRSARAALPAGGNK